MNWQDKIAPEGVACAQGREWILTQPDPETAWMKCADGGFMFWVLGRLGVSIPAAVGYRAATRAVAYAADALDRAGITHTLRGLVIDSPESAWAAARAARAARVAEASAAEEAAAEISMQAEDLRELIPWSYVAAKLEVLG